MNLLLEELPTTFGGKRFNSDFRAALKFFEVFESEIPDDEKAAKIAALFFPEGVPNEDPWPFMETFLSGGEKRGGEGKWCFDFSIDSGRIFVSFFQAYGIDLTTAKLHWYVFLELFRGLPDDTIMQKTIELRLKEPDKNDSAEYRQKLRRAQDAVRLDTPGLGALFGG
jgi:hypothetical protein